MVKRLILLAILTVALVLAFSGAALANFGIHGAYMADTDACAGCHRAHTANSAITWDDNNAGVTPRSALLLVTPAQSGSTVMTYFCYTCHGSAAAGAATDVQTGQYDASSSVPAENGLGNLNGGGFEQFEGTATTSSHNLQDALGGSWPMWGSGQSVAQSYGLTCVGCHDVHGSSNYRILKDTVNGHVVGGYTGNFAQDADPNPDPFVISAEYGYPDGTGANGTTDVGFRLHKVYWPVVWSDNGANTIPTAYDGFTPTIAYKPNYTVARYGAPVGLDPKKGITGWCIACHEQYNTKAGTIDVEPDTGVDGVRTFGAINTAGTYDAGDGAGLQVRHRHPMNVPLSNFYVNGNEANGPVGDRALIYDPGTWQSSFANGDIIRPVDIPLEHQTGLTTQPVSAISVEVTSSVYPPVTVLDNNVNNYLGCLTCHRAHGTAATMQGYANTTFLGAPDSGSGGVPPANSSALLRADNRGVCERCHNK